MNTKEVVFKDKYGILALAAFPNKSSGIKEDLWKNSSFKFKLSNSLKNLFRIEKFKLKEGELC